MIIGAAKIRHIIDREERLYDYRLWHIQSFSSKCYVMDLDAVEYRFTDGQPRPVAVLELTRFDSPSVRIEDHLDKVLHRITEVSAQGQAVASFSRLLGVQAFLVVFRYDLSEFHVYNLTDGRCWWHLTPEKYMKWIEGLEP